jgi:CRISP-associated protein Cas1
VTTQALRLCAHQGVPVHYMTTTGQHLAVCRSSATPVHRRLRQFRALDQDEQALALARRLIAAKIELQLRHVRRLGRRTEELVVDDELERIRAAIRGVNKVPNRAELLGHEGSAARVYFDVLAQAVSARVDPRLVPAGRSRRPPKDRFNALLSFAYGLLYRDLTTSILLVGLDPAFGFLHQPRSTAFPLVLDLVELFRVPVVDVAVLGAVNRAHFDPDADFEVTEPRVWLTESGRKKLIGVYERRKHEEHRHPALGYSLSWARMMELEVRLLEKEWSGEPGLFARLRLH